MKRYRVIFLSLVAAPALLAASPAGKSFDPSPFAFRRDVSGSVEREGIARVRADAELFRHAAEGLVDVRVARRTEAGWVEQPYGIDSLVLRTEGETGAVEREERRYPVEVESIERDAEAGETRLLLRAGKAPLHALTVVTNDRNFRRGVRVQVPRAGEDDDWRTVHSGYIHRFDVGSLHDEDLTLRFDERTEDRYRLVVSNGKNLPVAIDGVTSRGPIRDIVFLAEPGDRWALFHGHAAAEDVERPDYDTAALRRAWEAGVRTVALALEAPAENEDYAPSASPSTESWLEKRWVLWIVIAAVVAGLIAAIYGTARVVDSAE